MIKEFNSDLTVLVASCDAYNDVARNFIGLFRKYWQDCPFEVVFVTEEKIVDSEGCGFDRNILCGPGGSWCSRLVKALDEIKTPYVLMLCDDDEKQLLEPITAGKEALPLLYDFDLMEQGGHITGWLVQGAAADAFDDEFMSEFDYDFGEEN